MDGNELRILSPCISEKTADLFVRYSSRLKYPHTKTSYTCILAGFCNECGCDFLSVTYNLVISYFSKKEKEYEISTLKWQASMLRSFSQFVDKALASAEPEEDADYSRTHYQNLFSKFPFEKISLGAANAPSLQDVDQVLSCLKDNHNFSAFAALSLVLRCGLTCSEVCSLSKGNFIMDKKGNAGIVFRGAQDRYIKLPADMITLLSALVDPTGDSDSPMFRSQKWGRPMSHRSLERYLKETCEEAGVPGFSLQQLRNLAIGIMLEGGASQNEVADYVGTGVEWIPRYDSCIPDLEHAAVDFSHIRII